MQQPLIVDDSSRAHSLQGKGGSVSALESPPPSSAKKAALPVITWGSLSLESDGSDGAATGRTAGSGGPVGPANSCHVLGMAVFAWVSASVLFVYWVGPWDAGAPKPHKANNGSSGDRSSGGSFCYDMLYTVAENVAGADKEWSLHVPWFNVVLCCIPPTMILWLHGASIRAGNNTIQRMLPIYQATILFIALLDFVHMFALIYAQALTDQSYKVFWIIYRGVYRSAELSLLLFLLQPVILLDNRKYGFSRDIICLTLAVASSIAVLLTAIEGIWFMRCDAYVPQQDLTYAEVRSIHPTPEQAFEYVNTCRSPQLWIFRDISELMIYALAYARSMLVRQEQQQQQDKAMHVAGIGTVAFSRANGELLKQLLVFNSLFLVTRLLASGLIVSERDAGLCFLALSSTCEVDLYLVRVAALLSVDSHAVHQQKVLEFSAIVAESAKSLADFRQNVSSLVPKDFMVTEDQFQRDRVPFAAGHSSEVYKGRFLGEAVAVKRIPMMDHTGLKYLPEFIREIYTLSKLHHPCILKMYGLCAPESARHLYLLTEFCPHSLSSVLFSHSNKYAVVATSDDDTAAASKDGENRLSRNSLFTDELRLQIARQIAGALAYCHSKGIVHRDMKPSNVLLDHVGSVRVCDFGLASGDSVGQTRVGIVGTPAFMAPEIYFEGKFSPKVDVYSFAVLLWCLWSHELPYQEWMTSTFGLLLKVARSGMRPDCENLELPTGIEDLMRDCWATDAVQRPPFAAIEAKLREFTTGQQVAS